MPALTMRGRYLMREYWSDSALFTRLTAEQREIYVGLWTLADDAGWLPRDVPAIAAALYRFEDHEPREARLRVALARLKVLGKLESYRCGCLFLPAVAKYPRAGKKSVEHQSVHQTHLNGSEPHSNALPDPTLPIPYPTLPNVARAHARGGPPSKMREAMAALGLKPEVSG